MKEAMGGIFTMQAIVVFLVLATGLLAFSVSYTKSFRVKNEIRRIIEQYEGLTESAATKINAVAEKYNYTFSTPGDYVNMCSQSLGEEWKAYRSTLENGETAVFCVKCTLSDAVGTSVGENKYKGAYYNIATFINIDIPLINKFFPKNASFLRVEGETALIYSSGTDTEVCRYANIE